LFIFESTPRASSADVRCNSQGPKSTQRPHTSRSTFESVPEASTADAKFDGSCASRGQPLAVDGQQPSIFESTPEVSRADATAFSQFKVGMDQQCGTSRRMATAIKPIQLWIPRRPAGARVLCRAGRRRHSRRRKEHRKPMTSVCLQWEPPALLRRRRRARCSPRSRGSLSAKRTGSAAAAASNTGDAAAAAAACSSSSEVQEHCSDMAIFIVVAATVLVGRPTSATDLKTEAAEILVAFIYHMAVLFVTLISISRACSAPTMRVACKQITSMDSQLMFYKDDTRGCLESATTASAAVVVA